MSSNPSYPSQFFPIKNATLVLAKVFTKLIFIFRSTYELFKYYLNTNKDTSKAGREDTIEDLKLSNQRHVPRGGAEETDKQSRGDTRLWDQIVTDIPRQVPGVLRAESQVNTDLVTVSDRTFPGYRT